MKKIHIITILIFVSIALISNNLIWYSKFGWHLTKSAEMPYYLGIATGEFRDLPGLFPLHNWKYDPTTYVFTFLSLLFERDELFFVTPLFLSLLFAFTGVIAYWAVLPKYGTRAAFFLGLVYPTLLNVIGNSELSFTHDCFQLPLYMIFIGFLIRYTLSSEKKWIILSVILILFSLLINWSILLLFPSFLFVLFFKRIDKSVMKYTFVILSFFIGISFVRIFAGGFILELAQESSGFPPEIFYDLADVTVPAHPMFFWYRFHYILPFTILGFAYSLRKKDVLFVTSLPIALFGWSLLGRNARFLNQPIALLACIGFAVALPALFKLLKRANIALAILVHSLLGLFFGFLIYFFPSKFVLIVLHPLYLSISVLTFILIWVFCILPDFSLYLIRNKKLIVSPVIICCFIAFFGNVAFYMYNNYDFCTVIDSSGLTESQYQAYIELREFPPGMVFNINIYQGYLTQYLLPEFETYATAWLYNRPDRLNIIYSLWNDEESAWKDLTARNIDYVILSTREIEKRRSIWGSQFLIKGTIGQLDKISVSGTAIFDLLYNENYDQKYFELLIVKHENPPFDSFVYKIFRVRKEDELRSIETFIYPWFS